MTRDWSVELLSRSPSLGEACVTQPHHEGIITSREACTIRCNTPYIQYGRYIGEL